MSVNIGTNKLKFSVFGRGYDDERGNSGKGNKAPDTFTETYPLKAVIDTTGRYCWLSYEEHGSWFYRVKKYDMLNGWAEVPQTIFDNSVSRPTTLIHPSNTNNNLGIAFIYTNDSSVGYIVKIFDMTDGTVLKEGTYADGSASIYWDSTQFDAIIVGDYIYILNAKTNDLWTINTETMSVSRARYDSYGKALWCFADNNTIQGCMNPVWFTDWKYMYGYGFDFSFQWEVMADAAGSAGFPRIQMNGWGGNGYYYLPSQINGKWKVGKYSANSGSDFTTPTPIESFGYFPDGMNLNIVGEYNNGRTKNVTRANNTEVWLIDFALKDVTKLGNISTSNSGILAVTDDVALVRTSIRELTVYYI